MRRWGILAVAIGSAAVATLAGALTVHVPAPGARLSRNHGWLVLESAQPVRVTVEGTEVRASHEEGAVRHFRLEGLRPEGTEISVSRAEESTRFTLYGGVSDAPAFHGLEVPECVGCHDQGEAGCTGCHRWEGAKHAPVLAEGCSRCHASPTWLPREMGPVCSACHAAYAGGKHPRLRHKVSADRDPLRPGRRMDCASCHDPHAPRCLSCLKRGELRQWCLRCHSSG